MKKSYFKTKTRPASVGGRRTLEEMKHNELVHLLDAEISFFVRASEAIKAGSPVIKCYTCGSPYYWQAMDCGHFEPRAEIGTRWDLNNLRPQCKRCNWTLEGNKVEYKRLLEAELGKDVVDQLHVIAQGYRGAKIPREWLIEQIKLWRAKNAPLRKEVKCL
jgi:hypothetical protein